MGRQTFSNLVNERASVSVEMAYRPSKAFGSTPETWLGMQSAFDLARSRHLEQAIQVERVNAAWRVRVPLVFQSYEAARLATKASQASPTR